MQILFEISLVLEFVLEGLGNLSSFKQGFMGDFSQL